MSRDSRGQVVGEVCTEHNIHLVSMKERPRGQLTSSKRLIAARAIPLMVFQPVLRLTPSEITGSLNVIILRRDYYSLASRLLATMTGRPLSSV